jgi:hypothetical protein
MRGKFLSRALCSPLENRLRLNKRPGGGPGWWEEAQAGLARRTGVDATAYRVV